MTIQPPYASVLVPTFNPGPRISDVLRAVINQECPFDVEIVIVDSGSTAGDLARLGEFPARLHQIQPADFNHGGTRNCLAQLARGDILVYLSQDAVPADAMWLANLVRPLRQPEVAGVYARQVPAPSSTPLERYFLNELYGRTRIVHRPVSAPDRRPQRTQVLFSNVSSAIRRDVWERIPFRNDVLMSEDQYWAHGVLNAGYELVYEPASRVVHSHNYTLASLFERNRRSGASLRSLIGEPVRKMGGPWARFVARELVSLIREGHVAWVPYAVVYELTRALAFTLGLAEASWKLSASQSRKA